MSVERRESEQRNTHPVPGGCCLLRYAAIYPRYAGKDVGTASTKHWVAVTPATRGNDRYQLRRRLPSDYPHSSEEEYFRFYNDYSLIFVHNLSFLYVTLLEEVVCIDHFGYLVAKFPALYIRGLLRISFCMRLSFADTQIPLRQHETTE